MTEGEENFSANNRGHPPKTSGRRCFPLNLIVCSESCVHQRDGYCVLERPCAIPNPQGPAENRCIYLEPKPSGSSEAR